MKAEEVAKYILSLADYKKGQEISNLALQKLLYYCQGYFLAYTGNRLFEEDIEAWQYGPVVPKIYNLYKKFKDKFLPNNKLTAEEKARFEKEQKIIIELVVKKYSKYSAIGLIHKTHNESPWQNTKLNTVITDENLQIFFKANIEKITEFLFIEKTKKIIENLNVNEINQLPTYKFKYI